MTKLTDLTRYADAQRCASSGALWDLFDGNREALNIAHECIDRHADELPKTPAGKVNHKVLREFEAANSSSGT